MTIREGPPVIAERLLSGALRHGPDRQAVLGDLHEEFLQATAQWGRGRAVCRYWWHALSLSVRFAARRRRGVPALPVPKGDSLMRLLVQEARYAIRSLLKRPALAGVVIVTLALGLGANAAIFAIVDALVLRPFPFHDVDRIVLMTLSRPDRIDRQEVVSPANFLDLRDRTTTIRQLTAVSWWDVNLVGRDEPERVLGFHVTPDFFQVIGVEPVLGRAFVGDDGTRGRHQRVVLSHGLWTRRFGGDPGLVGQAVEIDGAPHEVIGVAPEGFDFPNGSEIWGALAFAPEEAARRAGGGLTVIGRLAPGRTLEDAQAEAAVLGERLARDHPDANRDRVARVYTLARGMMDVGLGPILVLWQASGAFVLLIACANIGNLLIARGSERRREIAVRLALGANRRRLARELLVESGVLAAVAVPLALAMTYGALHVLVSAMPAHIARFVAGWHDIDVDGRNVLFTAALAVAALAVFGLAPALQASRRNLVGALNDGGRTASAGGGRQRLRRALVVAQMALALPLLVTAGLSVMGTWRFLNGPQGYDPDQLLTAQVVLPESRYPDADARRRFTTETVERLSRLQGARVAMATNVLPAQGSNATRAVEIAGQPIDDPANPPAADYRAVTPGYFETMRIPILEGRGFSDGDREGGRAVAIVSRSMADRHWPGRSPLGGRVRMQDGEWLTVVGVAGDVIHDWFGRRNYPTLFTPYVQQPSGYLAFVVRTAAEPLTLASGLREAVREVDPIQPVFDVRTMRQLLSNKTIGLQYITSIMGVFAGLALVLAAVGSYALMAFLVTQRTHEFGVRVAVGATPGDLVRLGLTQAIRLAGVGVALGLVLSMALNRLIQAGLLGIVPSDARVFAGVAALLAVTTLLAGYLPARRAARLDPLAALRQGIS